MTLGLGLPAQEQSLAQERNIFSKHLTNVLRAWLELEELGPQP